MAPRTELWPCMASLNSAFNTVFDADFFVNAATVVAGMWLGSMGTDWARANVLDVGMTGGDVLYAGALSVALLAVMRNRWTRFLGLGMMAGAVMNEAQSQGLV